MSTTTPTSPAYYQLASAVEIHEITGEMTSNAGQAIQYIARSSRLDGVTKAGTLEGRIEDLEKAKVFLDFEIDRLHALRGGWAD